MREEEIAREEEKARQEEKAPPPTAALLRVLDGLALWDLALGNLGRLGLEVHIDLGAAGAQAVAKALPARLTLLELLLPRCNIGDAGAQAVAAATPATVTRLDLNFTDCNLTDAGAQAVIAALTDALGVTHIDMPATPQAIWEALQGKREAAE